MKKKIKLVKNDDKYNILLLIDMLYFLLHQNN